MKAVCWHGKKDIRVDNVSLPSIIDPRDISHRFSLTEAPKAYELFNNKEDNCIKVILKP